MVDMESTDGKDVERERETETWVDVDLEANQIQARRVVETVVEVEELFIGGRLTLWRDGHGWSGFELRDRQYYSVSEAHGIEERCGDEPVSEAEVVEKVEAHIKDPDAGGRGEFVRGCTPR